MQTFKETGWDEQLKGTVTRDFRLLVFSWISFPQTPEYTIRDVSNFLENSRRYSQFKVHRWQMEKIFNHKSLIILFGYLLEVELTNRCIFAFKFTLRSQQPDIVPIFLPPVSLLPVSTTPVANFPLVSLTPVANWFMKKLEAKNLVSLSL